MTLHTRMAIVEPTPVKEVFDEARRLIGGEHAAFDHEPSNWKDGVTVYRNRIAQGLPALLWVEYGADAPLRPDPKYADDPDERSFYPPVDDWSIEVNFDTAYAYREENGAGCSDLHAWLIRELGRWLSQRGLTWFWYDEFNGDWHPSSDAVTTFGDPEIGRPPTPVGA